MKTDTTQRLPEPEFGDLRSRFQRAVHLTVEGGAKHYKRKRSLPRLISYSFQDENHDPGVETLDIVRRLYGAIRHERQLGKTGHWAYDLNRHIGLRQALRAELVSLRKIKMKEG